VIRYVENFHVRRSESDTRRTSNPDLGSAHYKLTVFIARGRGWPTTGTCLWDTELASMESPGPMRSVTAQASKYPHQVIENEPRRVRMRCAKPADVDQRTRFTSLRITARRTIFKISHPTLLHAAQLQTPMFGRRNSESREKSCWGSIRVCGGVGDVTIADQSVR
jgi:hypothetical protein